MALLQKSERGVGARNVRDIYPSQHATGAPYPTPAKLRRGDEREVNALLCAQCNFPIKDGSRIGACPACTSDNFAGERLSR